ncbi:MAG: RecX family transcriptional regulator [Nitrospirae bacterium]|nr:RecX family transcriptional regulator [Nitrospirota bacterium]
MTASAGNARRYALLLLRYRGRSEKELRERLKKKGYLAEEIETTVAYLLESGFLDDRALAENLKRQAMTNKLLGFEGARRFMQQRGLPKEIIGEALAYDEDDELRNIRKLIEKKQRSISRYPEPKRTQSLMGSLMRKGYSTALIRKALKNTITDEETEE